MVRGPYFLRSYPTPRWGRALVYKMFCTMMLSYPTVFYLRESSLYSFSEWNWSIFKACPQCEFSQWKSPGNPVFLSRPEELFSQFQPTRLPSAKVISNIFKKFNFSWFYQIHKTNTYAYLFRKLGITVLPVKMCKWDKVQSLCMIWNVAQMVNFAFFVPAKQYNKPQRGGGKCPFAWDADSS